MNNNKRAAEATPRVSRRKFMAQATTVGGAGLIAATAGEFSAQEKRATLTRRVPGEPTLVLLGTMVEYNSGGLMIPAYLSRPAGKKKQAPAVLVIHEVFGLNDHIKAIADRIAHEGYVALAPDFFARASEPPPKDASDVGAIRKAAISIPPEAAIKDMQAGLDLLKADKGVKGHLAAIGFCMGGGFSYQIATHTKDLAGAVIFYGRTPLELVPQVSCPLLASFGGLDKGIPPEGMQAWIDALTKAGKSVDAKVYPAAGHGFFNDTRPTAYNAEAAADAWQRVLKFFHERLGK